MNRILFVTMVMLVGVAGADGERDYPRWIRWVIGAGSVAVVLAAGRNVR
jgi:hypothetical protein